MVLLQDDECEYIIFQVFYIPRSCSELWACISWILIFLEDSAGSRSLVPVYIHRSHLKATAFVALRNSVGRRGGSSGCCWSYLDSTNSATTSSIKANNNIKR